MLACTVVNLGRGEMVKRPRTSTMHVETSNIVAASVSLWVGVMIDIVREAEIVVPVAIQEGRGRVRWGHMDRQWLMSGCTVAERFVAERTTFYQTNVWRNPT